MRHSNTSTYPPYSGAGTSSTPTQPAAYLPTPAPSSSQGNDSGFTTKEVLIYGGGLILTAVVTYFSTLISVNSDISNNRENISVIKSDLTHLQDDVSKAENDIAKSETGISKIEVIEAKVIGLEKQLDAHISAANNEKGITK